MRKTTTYSNCNLKERQLIKKYLKHFMVVIYYDNKKYTHEIDFKFQIMKKLQTI